MNTIKAETNVIMAFGENIRNYRRSHKKKISQTQLCMIVNRKLEAVGCHHRLTQRKLSRIEHGEATTISFAVVAQLGEICQISEIIMDEIKDYIRDASIKENANFFVKGGYQLIANVDNPAFKKYLGSYYCYFRATDPRLNKINYGKLELTTELKTSTCQARMEILDVPNGKAIKEYVGQFILNLRFRSWYCFLIEKNTEELCVLMSRYFNTSLFDNQLSVAFVLTTAAGTKKHPVVHKLFLSRKELNESELRLITAQLKMYSDEIVISESQLLQAENDLECIDRIPTQYKNAVKETALDIIEQIKNKGRKEIHYSISRNAIASSNDPLVCSISDVWIRRYSCFPYNIWLAEEVEEECISIIENR